MCTSNDISIELIVPISKCGATSKLFRIILQSLNMSFPKGDDVEMAASLGPQCFAAFAATMGQIGIVV